MENYNVVDILIIEDNPLDAELTIRALKKHKLANNIHVIEDGAEALDFFFCRGKYALKNETTKPRVVLLDLKLPKISGLEVLKIIKTNPKTSSIPVVAITSSQEEPDIKEAYKLGVNSYVVKPVDFEQFLGAMGNLGMYWLLVNKTI